MTSTASTTASTTYFPALTGIRAIAALMVVFFHIASKIDLKSLPLVLWPAVQFARQWHIGVAIFFVLSGFLITNRYADRIQLTGNWFRRYMQNRFARIFPVYFLLTAVSFGVMWWRPFHMYYEWPDTYTAINKFHVVLLNLTLTRAYFRDLLTIGLPTAWSLTVEETFYLIAPLLLFGLKRDLRRIFTYPVILISLGFGLVAFCTRFLPFYGLMANANFMLNFTFFGRATEFIAGMGLALWMGKQSRRGDTGFTYTLLGVAGIIIFMIAITVLHKYQPVSGSENWSYAQILANILVLPVFICALLWGLITEKTKLRRVLETKPLDLLGRSSYVLYLIHLGSIDSIFREYISDNIFIVLLSYILLSVLLYKFVEHPLHTLLRAKSIPKPVDN